MTNFILVLVLATPIALLPLVHLVTGCEGDALVIATVLIQVALLLLIFVFGDNDDK